MSEEDKCQWFEIPDRNIEYIEPNLSLAYAELAPLVTEARAFMKCKEHHLAMISLNKACSVIEAVSMRMAVFKPDVKHPMPAPNTISGLTGG